MKPSRRCLAIACLAQVGLLLTPRAGWAWGTEGNMIVALVADRLLQAKDPAARKELNKILATDKDNSWTKTDIAGEATWADVLRDKSPEGRIATSNWHYVRLDPDNPDVKKACFGRPGLPASTPASHGPKDACAIEKIEQLAKELRSSETSAHERLLALRFLLTLVGDLHQPLAAIERQDQGGQCVAILAPGAKTPIRLETYWNDTLVAEAVGRDAAKAAGAIVAALSPADIEKWSGGTLEDWVREAHEVAKSAAYNLPPAAEGKHAFPVRKGEKDPCGAVPLYRVDAAYRDRAIAAVKEQLAKAGVRLAHLLRENLK
jgi:hypothetical protein